jgi:hypothetical protein
MQKYLINYPFPMFIKTAKTYLTTISLFLIKLSGKAKVIKNTKEKGGLHYDIRSQ